MPLNEGQTVQYTVITTRVADGTVLYWRTTGNTTNSDIVGGNTGTVTITNNQGVFNVATTLDITQDGTKTLGIALSTGSLSGPTVTTTTSDIVVNDTSQPPVARLYVWGQNSSGMLGLNDQIHRSSPVQLGSETNWNQITGGREHTMATKADNSLWIWGKNNAGQLGTNNTIYRSSPVQVGTDTNWSKVKAGSDANMAIKTDGTLWAWGSNPFGHLGINSTGASGYRSSPTQIAGNNWRSVSIWVNSAMATKTDGTLWTWGLNSRGQLGKNDQGVARSSPVQVGTDTNWNLIAISEYMTVATKTDGTLWLWGSNTYGQLGLNDRANRSSPTQVGTATNWNLISLSKHHTVATKTDGTLWLWGRAGYLGTNDNIARSSPVQVAGTTWNQIAAGQNIHTVATKTDGTLWAWGRNFNGPLGTNSRNNGIEYSSPVQIGSNTNWGSLSAGGEHTIATTTI